jgi:hypothetical protein
MTTPKPPERTFLPRCPDCRRLLADTGKPHCQHNPACDWLRCKCGALIQTDGTWNNGKRRGVVA